MSKKLIFIFGFSFLLLQIYVYGNFALAQENTVPTINIYPDIFYPLDEVLYLEGRAVSDSIVQINFQKPGSKPLNVNTKSDFNGEWVFSDKVPLEAGNWEIRARVIKNSEKTSLWSNPRLVKVISTGFVIGGGYDY